MKNCILYSLAGNLYPIVGTVKSEQYGVVPLLDHVLMSDEEWTEMCRRDYLRRYEEKNGPQTAFPEEDFNAYCAAERARLGNDPIKNIPVTYYG